ncbi:GDSL-type esterase/lipase family protein [Niabella pedocola]|uniref:GDSL-type esterase/lipase family protein n=1 Tax=Niabella pedocola TaxID=1752077 RepID=A0ABS8PN80_9BACT|nr:GDSL-type esterase/lipase family protein [Niabella pedocola]MCD2422548.1 GDSL-type esterase/lipase family protein [Niabella pedocola]
MLNRRRFLGNLCMVSTGITGLWDKVLPSPGIDLKNNGHDLSRITGLLKRKEPVKWLFTGDSITQGAKHTHGMRSYPEVFSERVRWELGRPRDVIINTAISGNTSVDLCRDLDQRIFQYQPQVVLLMLGTNDAALQKKITPEHFKANMTMIIDRIRTQNGIPVLLSPNRIIATKAPERSTLKNYIAVLDELAASRSLVYINVWSEWDTGLKQKYQGQQNARLLNDPLHPNGFGHQEIAILLFKAFSIYDPAASTCGGPYYEGAK